MTETMNEVKIINWKSEDVELWLKKEGFSEAAISLLCDQHKIDGKCVLSLSEQDFGMEPVSKLLLNDRKHLFLICTAAQKANQDLLAELDLTETIYSHQCNKHEISEPERISQTLSEDSQYKRLPTEKRKAFLAFCYFVLVTWITSFVMVIVHERVPDMKKYPPLPDIFLDNIPHIPWAFEACELCGTLLLVIWSIILLFHKHRFILMRRFFALSGTVFLLRCVTMLITSLSVPGDHLQCQPHNFTFHSISIFDGLATKISQAYMIWRGAGISIQGVRTCGDYMFSGHTIALTMLNFCITEYTPSYTYYLHIFSWILNMFGVFFILAAHEHYSIDVFVAFYITTRLFLYYHTFSNNQTLMQRDSNRTKIWFPLFSYFESSVDGIVPNEYQSLMEIYNDLWTFIKGLFSQLKELSCLIFTSESNTPAESNHAITERVSSSMPEDKRRNSQRSKIFKY